MRSAPGWKPSRVLNSQTSQRDIPFMNHSPAVEDRTFKFRLRYALLFLFIIYKTSQVRRKIMQKRRGCDVFAYSDGL